MNTHPLSKTLDVLTREWFDGQLRDLPAEDMPPVEEVAADIAAMRNNTLQRIMPALHQTDCLSDDRPDDGANAAAVARLAAAFVGLEATTPTFTKLALSKIGIEGYTAGWPLCAIRLVAETWLPQARQLHDQRKQR